MATAKQTHKTVTREVVRVEQVTVNEIVLTLSFEEAIVLRNVMRSIGGPPNDGYNVETSTYSGTKTNRFSPRYFTQSIEHALEEANVPELSFDKAVGQQTIYFEPMDRIVFNSLIDLHRAKRQTKK